MAITVQSGRVLQATNANRLAYPASLAKLMTALLVFERLEQQGLQLGARLPVSARAASQPATKVYLREGQNVKVETLLSALLVVSANDAAMALAEALHGTEERFVAAMNRRAKQLGMRRTRFVNASGLPGPGQRTTASDMAILARTLWQRFPHRAGLYTRPALQLGKRRYANVNAFLTSFAGADGMKTGYTCAAGFNLVASAHRDRHRIIVVVLGAATRDTRLSRAKQVMLQAIEALAKGTPDAHALTLNDLVAAAGPDTRILLPSGSVAADCHPGHAQARGWSVDLGASAERNAARRRAANFIKSRRREGFRLPGARVTTVPHWIGVQLHRGLVTGLAQAAAIEACVAYRESGGDCVVVPPDNLRAQLEEVQRIRRLRRWAKQRGMD